MSSWESFIVWLYGSKTAPGTGALLDTRPEEQKQADVHFAEIVASAALVNWITKAASAWRRFPILNQGGSNGCVAFTMAKLLGIMRFLKDGVFVLFSGGDVYRRRVNAPGAGMIGSDAYAIAAKGVTLDAVFPTQNLTDQQIAALAVPEFVEEIAELFKLSNPQPILLPIGDIEAVASVIQTTGKGVMTWFYFTSREWSALNGGSGADYNVPAVLDTLSSPSDAAALRHSVSAVDFTLYNGKKALIIEDSAWFGNLKRRVVTEDWYKARNFFVAYPMNFKQEKVVDADAVAKYVFTKTLSFIPWNDATNAPADPVLNAAQLTDVTALQTILQQLTDKNGNTYFPTNVTPTGYYGALTAKCVLAWGLDYLPSVVPVATLIALAGKSFGEASRGVMNPLIA